MDERNIPLSDADLDKILPSQGYEVSIPPPYHPYSFAHNHILFYFSQFLCYSGPSLSLLLPNGLGLITFVYQFLTLAILLRRSVPLSLTAMEVLNAYLLKARAWME